MYNFRFLLIYITKLVKNNKYDIQLTTKKWIQPIKRNNKLIFKISVHYCIGKYFFV